MGYNPRMTKKASAPASGTSLLIANSKITLTLPQKTVAQSYQKHLARLATQVSIPGFRKGKVPTKVAEEQLGKGHIIEHVLDELLPTAYTEAVKTSKKTPVTRPEFRVVAAELGKDWLIEAEFAELPTVNLNKYQQHVKAGKKAAAEEKKKPAEKRKEVKLTPEQEKERQLQYIFRELVLQLKPQVPELLLKHETQHEFEHLVDQLKQLNLTVDDYLKRRNSNMEQLSQELAIQTLNRLQLDLILGAIARQEKLTVTDKDRETYFAQIKDVKQREQLKKDAHYLGHLETALIKQKVVDSLLTL